MKHVARDEHKIWSKLDHCIDDAPQRRRHIRLALVDPGGSLSLVLPKAEVYVGEVNQSHRARITLIHCVIFVRTSMGERFASPGPADAGTIVDRTMMLLLLSVIQPSRRSI